MGSRILSRFLGGERIPRERVALPETSAQPGTTTAADLSPSDVSLKGCSDGSVASKLVALPSAMAALPTSVGKLPATFGASLKAVTKRPLLAREVTRGPDERVIGPAFQYVASAVNNNKSPFTPGTAAKWFTYFALLYGIMKAGIFNGPADFVSVADDVVDTIVGFATSTADGNPTLSSKYFDGFDLSVFKCNPKQPADIPGQTCYAPGGSYYKSLAKSPQAAELWGYADGLTPDQKTALLALIALGGVGAFAFANRRRLQSWMQTHSATDARDMALSAAKTGAVSAAAAAFCFGVSRELAHPIAAWVMILLSVYTFAKEYRVPHQQVPDSKNLPMNTALMFGTLWLAGITLYRTLADSAGLYQFTPNGYATIYGNWDKWDWTMNFPFLVADLTTEFFLMAPLWARSGSMVQNTVDVAVAGATRFIHGNHVNPGLIRRWFQARVPELKAQPGPDGITYPDYWGVRPAMLGYSKAEKDDVRAGKMPDGRISQTVGHTLAAGALGTLSAVGVRSSTDLLTGQSHHVVLDAILMASGLAAAGLLADAAIHDGKGRKLYSQLASFLAHQFGPQGRGLYWTIYSVVGTVFTTGMGVTSQTIKGITPDKDYLWNLVRRSFVNPWMNRLHMGWRTAYWPDKALSKFAFYLPGYFLVYCSIEFGGTDGQMTKSTTLLYNSIAREFALSTDPAHKSELLDQLRNIEGLVEGAVNENGYGRPETLKQAIATMNAIRQAQTQNGIPSSIP